MKVLRSLFVLAILALAAFAATPAWADAPDPIPGNTHGTIVTNSDGSRTLTVWGGSWVGDPAGTTQNNDPNGTIVTAGWQWTTHGKDCNTDRSGAGYAIVWNDPTQAGNLIDGGNLGDFYVGVAFPGSATNPTDNTVHPTPIQDIAGATMVDSSDYTQWRGGCGLYVDHPPTVLPNGQTKSGFWSQGVWGPISHTYAPSVKGPLSVCPVMYDVHGQHENTEPNGAKEITAGGSSRNGDNSIQSNGSTPQGNGCFATNFANPHLTIVKDVSKDGGSNWSDSVTVHAGDAVQYRFTVTNDGDTGANLTGVHVNELSNLADCDNTLHVVSPAGFTATSTLAVGDSAVFECTHTMGSSDLTNVATASGSYTPQGGQPQPVTSDQDTAVVHVIHPAIDVTKTASETAVHVGDVIHYTVTIKNTGDTSLTVNPSDTGCSGFDGSSFTLVAGESKTLTCTHTATAGDGSSYTNTASATGTDSQGGTVTDNDHVTTPITHPSMDVTKTVDKSSARVGDTLTYTITVHNTGDVLLHVSNFADHVQNSQVAGCTFASGQEPPATFDLAVAASRSFTCTHVVAASDPNPYTNVACVDATDGVGSGGTFSDCGEATTTPSDALLTIDKVVNKDHAYDGDVLTYTIVVKNIGRATATNVRVSDLIQGTGHSCGTLSGPAQGGSLAPGQSITYTCTYTVQHGDEDSSHHVVNVATATGQGPNGDNLPPVNDSATTLIVHPAIGIDKSGPATATAGDTVSYVLTVTNPGDSSFAESTVQVSDPKCDGQPVTLIGKGGDSSPNSFDPGDVWTYSCSVKSTESDTAIHNVATVQATNADNHTVNASDTADTTLNPPPAPPQQAVLGERVTPGTAQLLGPTGCVAKAFNARIRGTKIATVTFVLDGKVVKRFKKPVANGVYTLRVNPANMRVGVHRIVVNVTFRSGSGTRPKTLHLSFQRCAKKLAAPRFTG